MIHHVFFPPLTFLDSFWIDFFLCNLFFPPLCWFGNHLLFSILLVVTLEFTTFTLHLSKSKVNQHVYSLMEQIQGLNLTQFSLCPNHSWQLVVVVNFNSLNSIRHSHYNFKVNVYTHPHVYHFFGSLLLPASLILQLSLLVVNSLFLVIWKFPYFTYMLEGYFANYKILW